jgi:threonylcarbamoyladenosine tRNA methylthiotransferase MtaB
MSNTRAFIKVQDGCDNRCTFCITTVARGAGVSRPLGEIVAEIQALSSAGYKEVVLTGVHLGSYGKGLHDRNSLQVLIKAILTNSDIPRLRISSLEPWDIDPDFFELWQDRRLLPHLHLPLQSGSDAILRRMARRTTRESFRRLVCASRDAIPGLSLSTDIIVGFPGESEHDFLQSMEYVREMNFSRLHVFSYSARPGTAAAEMSGHIASDLKKDRTRQMISLGKTLSHDFHKGFEGQTRSVLWESSTGADKNGLLWAGYTDNYIRVQANGPLDLTNKITPARLIEAQPQKMTAALPDPYGE